MPTVYVWKDQDIGNLMYCVSVDQPVFIGAGDQAGVIERVKGLAEDGYRVILNQSPNGNGDHMGPTAMRKFRRAISGIRS